jgi:uncharacterized protein YrrD
MYRVSDIIRKPIVSAETGDRLGSVSDVLLEDGSISLVALVVSDGLLAKEQVLPLRDVKMLGGDTVLAHQQTGILDLGQWRQSGVKATRSSALRGKPVVTVSGHRLGEVSDLLVDEKTGAFSGLEVAKHDLGGLRTRRSIIQGSQEIRVGPDAVVVPDAAAHDRDAGEGSTATHERA